MRSRLAGLTKRRFQCRRFGQGSGKSRSIAASEPGGSQSRSSAASPPKSRTFAKPAIGDRRDRLRHAVDEGLDADEAALPVRRAPRR